VSEDKETSLLGRKVSRRTALTLAGTFGAGMALGGGGALSARELAGGDQTVEFYGEHQAGISTPQQDRLHFAAFDLTVSKAGEVRELLRAWSDAAAKMCAGKSVGGGNDAFVPPEDTGEAQDLTAGRLTAGCIDTEPLALGRILWPISRGPCADRTYAPCHAGHVH